MAGSNRLLKEYKEILSSRSSASASSSDIVLFPPDDSNLYAWSAHIRGPPDTPYADHWFTLKIQVPKQYPLAPPKVMFVTRVCHPNVHFKSGEICLDVLKDAWTPIWTLESTCRAIIALLGTPDATSPLNCDISNLYRGGDVLGAESLVRMYTEDFGCKTMPPVKTLSKKM